MNRNGDAVQSTILLEALTNSKQSEPVRVPRASQRIASFGSHDTFSDDESGVGNDPVSRLLTVAEVAALLNVPRKWVYRRVVLKPPEGIPHVKVGKYLRFRESDLRNYVDRLRRN